MVGPQPRDLSVHQPGDDRCAGAAASAGYSPGGGRFPSTIVKFAIRCSSPAHPPSSSASGSRRGPAVRILRHGGSWRCSICDRGRAVLSPGGLANLRRRVKNFASQAMSLWLLIERHGPGARRFPSFLQGYSELDVLLWPGRGHGCRGRRPARRRPVTKLADGQAVDALSQSSRTQLLISPSRCRPHAAVAGEVKVHIAESTPDSPGAAGPGPR